ncbi:AI-2E family transporter domain-containing protein [Ditylenchus destructor]|uniref:AI-2E family transporter domain-containing protein n=1 Tax=Ditylenchus destructor TaxID=166010 RepID=A0AAD4MEU3_9BILA|nr:AI-2E family transporter domain-containing protein [Ditylenchus destructor]
MIAASGQGRAGVGDRCGIVARAAATADRRARARYGGRESPRSAARRADADDRRGAVLALPFALKAGSPFFLPLTAALVVAVALVPVLEGLERHRVPTPLAALICVLLFLTAANAAIVSIVVPAWSWLSAIPSGSTTSSRTSGR